MVPALTAETEPCTASTAALPKAMKAAEKSVSDPDFSYLTPIFVTPIFSNPRCEANCEVIPKFEGGGTTKWAELTELHFHICRIPDDCIDPRRYPLLAAREAMRQLVDDLLGRSILASGVLS